MNVTTKKRCPLCGHLLERYPNNGEPLIHGEVCLQCNVIAVIPYRYFISAYERSPIAMVIRNGKIQVHKTSDGYWKLSNIELFLGKNIVFKTNAKLGLTFAFIKGYEEEPKELNIIAQKALKAPIFKSVMVIPTRLLKGVKLNE